MKNPSFTKKKTLRYGVLGSLSCRSLGVVGVQSQRPTLPRSKSQYALAIPESWGARERERALVQHGWGPVFSRMTLEIATCPVKGGNNLGTGQAARFWRRTAFSGAAWGHREQAIRSDIRRWACYKDYSGRFEQAMGSVRPMQKMELGHMRHRRIKHPSSFTRLPRGGEGARTSDETALSKRALNERHACSSAFKAFSLVASRVVGGKTVEVVYWSDLKEGVDYWAKRSDSSAEEEHLPQVCGVKRSLFSRRWRISCAFQAANDMKSGRDVRERKFGVESR